MLLPFFRMTTFLENLEKSGSSRVVRENLGKICSITASIVCDTKYERKEFFTRQSYAPDKVSEKKRAFMRVYMSIVVR